VCFCGPPGGDTSTHNADRATRASDHRIERHPVGAKTGAYNEQPEIESEGRRGRLRDAGCADAAEADPGVQPGHLVVTGG
jgi:hypothetical protein